MSAADDLFSAVRRTVGNTPIVLIAGASDLVSEKLRDLPATLNSLRTQYRDVPMKAAGSLVGQAFRANLKLGEMYDELTRRGQEVLANSTKSADASVNDDEEPFVREPFMPKPLHSAPKKAAPKKAVAKKAAPEKAAPKKAAVRTQAKER